MDVVFDIGANKGWETEDATMCDYHTRRPWVDNYRVVCVEPVPALCETLKEKFAKNDVTVVQAAVTDEEPESGEIDLWISEHDTMSTCSRERIDERHKFMTGHYYDNGKTEVASTPVTRIDKLVEEHGRPVFIKIDVEGYEHRVLNTFSERYCPISFEWGEQEKDNTLKSLLRCKELGYTKFWITFGNLGICSGHKDLIDKMCECEYWVGELRWMYQCINLVSAALSYDEAVTWMNNNCQHNRVLIIGESKTTGRVLRRTDPLWGQIYAE